MSQQVYANLETFVFDNDLQFNRDSINANQDAISAITNNDAQFAMSSNPTLVTNTPKTVKKSGFKGRKVQIKDESVS